jgi:hypothetical protein
MRGVMKDARKVDAAVNTTLNATFAFPKYVTTLLAVPPGQHPTNIKPTATEGCTGNTLPIRNPRKGMMVYCKATPNAICLGSLTALKKSSTSKVKPMPNMVNARAFVIMSPRNHVTSRGCVIPTTAPANTHRGNASVAEVKKERGEAVVVEETETSSAAVLEEKKPSVAAPRGLTRRASDVEEDENSGTLDNVPSALDLYVKVSFSRTLE